MSPAAAAPADQGGADAKGKKPGKDKLVDLQILGIGANGHVGFNEPTSSFASRTRIKTLTERTRADNARFFDSADDVPTHCLTQGLGTILDARHLVLFATGYGKAEAVHQLVEGPISAMWPPIATAPIDCGSVPGPPTSTTWSTPRPSVSARAFAPHSGVAR